EAGDTPEAGQIDVRVARLQWVEGPGPELVSTPPGIVPVSLLQGDPDAASPKLRENAQLMGAQAQLAIARAKKGEAEPDQPALGEGRTMDHAAIELARKQ